MSGPLLERTGRRRVSRKLLAGLAGLALAILIGGLLIPRLIRPRLPFHRQDYERALEAGDDGQVLEIYHALRAKRADLADAAQTDRVRSLDLEATALIRQIEGDASGKSLAIVDRVLSGAPLAEEEKAYLERYAPVTGHEMAGAVRRVVDLYLTGSIEEAAFRHFVGEMEAIPHLTHELKPLAERIDTLAGVRERLRGVLAAQASGSYEDAIHRMAGLVADTDLSGLELVAEDVNARLEGVWQAYFDEQIVLIRDEMARRRTYDAALRVDRLLEHFPKDSELLEYREVCERSNPETVVIWRAPVEHLSIKPLIADPERAFDGDRYEAAADRDLLLVSEFRRILHSLYEGGYVLVDGQSLVDQGEVFRGIPCPKGKTPLVLVLEDFYFSLPREESGLAARLDLDEQGRVVGVLRDRDGRERYDRGFTAIGLVESFVEEYPDFAFNGATGTIALVGRYGLFGYPVADVQDLALEGDRENMDPQVAGRPRTDFEANRAKVRELVARLQSRNWRIESGTYARLALPFSSANAIRDDLTMTARWIEPYTGPMTAIHCPFGDHLEADPERAALFTEAGYRLQSGYGPWAYQSGGRGYLYVSRSLVSGAGLRSPGGMNLDRFFEAARVIDRENRP